MSHNTQNKSKVWFYSFTLILLFYISSIYSQNWEWAKVNKVDSEVSYGKFIGVDNQGNIYAAGDYYNKISIDTITHNYNNNQEVFVTKINPEGSCSWIRTIRADHIVFVRDFSVDQEGNCYITGEYNKKYFYVDNDSYMVNISIFGSDSYTFFVSINTNGEVNWSNRLYGTHVPYMYLDNENNSVFLSEPFDNSLSLNSGNNTISSANNNDYYLFDQDGNFDRNSFKDKIRYKSEEIIEFHITNNNKLVFAYKEDTIPYTHLSFIEYTSELWNFNFNTTDFYINDIESDSDENLYMSGYYKNEFYINGMTISPIDEYNGIILKLNEYGDLLWYKSFSGYDHEIIKDLTVSNDSIVFICGRYRDALTIDYVNYINKNSTMYVARMDSSGEMQWVLFPDYDVNANPEAIAANSNNEAFITGFYSDKLKLGNNTFENTEYKTFFVAKINNDLHTPTIMYGDSIICKGIHSYYVLDTVKGVSYKWHLQGVGIIENNSRSLTYNFIDTGEYKLSVIPYNNQIEGDSLTKIIHVKQIPSKPEIIGDPSACLGTEAYNTNINSEYTYTWKLDTGGTLFIIDNTAIVDWEQTGDYELRLSTSNYCGSSIEDTMQITVNNLPDQPSEINGNNEVCVGIYSYSVTEKTGITYNWAISGGGTLYASGNQVTIHWTSAGNHVLSVTAGNSCGNSIARTLSVNVKTAPVQPTAIIGEKKVCPDNIETYTIIEKENEEYAWKISAGGILNANNGRADVDWVTPGTYTISVTPENECGTGQDREEIVEVYSIPEKPDTIFGLRDVCQGIQSYFVEYETNINYTWNLSGGGVLTPSKNIAEVEWTDSGTYSLTVTPYNMCGTGNSRTITVHVKGIEDQITEIDGDEEACAGEEVYEVDDITGLTYTWELDSGGVFTPDDTNAITINWTTKGEFLLKLSTSDGCSQSKIVNVEMIPDQASVITGDTMVCMAEQLYSVSRVTGVDYSWQVTGNNNIFSLYNTAEVDWQESGEYVLSVTPSNRCGDGSSQSLNVEVLEIPVSPTGFSGDTIACLGNNTYSVDNLTSINYSWKLDGIKYANDSTNIKTINFIDTGTFLLSVNMYNECGNGPILSKVIEAITIPEQPTIFGSRAACTGNKIYYVHKNKHELYSWSLSGGGEFISMNDSVNINWDSTGTFSLTVTPSNKCGAGESATIDIEVNSIPDKKLSISGDTLCCLGSKIYTVPLISTYSYNWTLNGGGTLIPFSNVAQVMWTTPGNYSLQLYPYNECGIGDTSIIDIIVNDIPDLPGVIYGDVYGCVGESDNYYIEEVQDVLFSWSISSNDLIEENGTELTVTWSGSGQKTITVKPSNYCGNGPQREIVVSVGELPDAPIFTYGDTFSCINKSQYRVNANSSVDYTWSLSGGGSLSSSNNNATVNWLNTGEYILSVFASNSCGNSSSSDLNIHVQDAPSEVDQINGDTITCLGKYLYSINEIDTAVNYLWLVSSGGDLNSSSYPISVNWSIPGIHYISVVPYNSCGNGSTTYLTVNAKDIPSQPNIIVGESNCCTGVTETYTVSNSNESNYRWTLTGGGIMSSSDNIASINWTENGDHTLTVTPYNICGTGVPRKSVITVYDEKPQISGQIEGDSIICVNNQYAFSVPHINGTDYYWNIEGNNNYTNILNLVHIKWFEKGNYIISVYPENSCGQGNTIKKQIKVEEDIQLTPITYTGDSLIALGEGNIQWYYNDAPIPFETENILIPYEEGEYYITYSNSCNIISSNIIYYSDLVNIEWDITVYPNPSSDYLTIILPINYTLKSIELIDRNGRTIKTFSGINNDKIRLDFTDIIPGTYYLRLNSGLKAILKRIVVF